MGSPVSFYTSAFYRNAIVYRERQWLKQLIFGLFAVCYVNRFENFKNIFKLPSIRLKTAFPGFKIFQYDISLSTGLGGVI